MIEASVVKNFGGFILDAKLADGGFICLSGRNGSGKTSLLSIIAGILKPDSGFVKINSVLVSTLPIERRRVVMVTPDSSIPHFDVAKHIRWGRRRGNQSTRGNGKKKNEKSSQIVADDEEWIALVQSNLGIGEEFARKKVGTLSLGMRERVSLATALLSKPTAILVDEAFSNLHDREEFIDTYREMCAKEGIDSIFSSQDARDSVLSNHHYSIEAGRLTRDF